MIGIENKTSIVSPKNSLPQKCGIHKLSLQRVLLLSLVLWIVSLIFHSGGLPGYDSYNPDYDSYEGLYESVTGYYLRGWEPFFVYLNYLGRYFQLSYDGFRSAILSLSLTNFIAAIYIFSRKLRTTVLQYRKQSMFFKMLVGLIFTFAFTVFFFEFFVIRIRAGLSISMVFLAFSLFWPGESRPGKLKFLLISILLVLAFATHKQTTCVLVYFIFYPVALSLLYSKRWFARERLFLKILLFCVVFMPAFMVVCTVIVLSGFRGYKSYSELNVFRLIALSVVPLIIVVFSVFNKTFVGLRSISKMQELNSNGVLLDRTVCQLMTWHYFTTASYVSMAFALLLSYITGTVDQSGEAIVRLITLTSPLAVFIILCATKFYRFFWLFILLSNSLFFVNAVFLSNF